MSHNLFDHLILTLIALPLPLFNHLVGTSILSWWVQTTQVLLKHAYKPVKAKKQAWSYSIRSQLGSN